MKETYGRAKQQLLELKKEIDDLIKNSSVTSNLVGKEGKLDSLFHKCLKLSRNEQDKKYISFNYYPCKAMISFSKGWKYNAMKEWLIGFKNLMEYVNKMPNPDKWRKSFNYYETRLSIILTYNIELFGNSGDDQFNKIASPLSQIIKAIVNNFISQAISEVALQIIVELLIKLINLSGGIYNQKHLERQNKLIKIIDQIPQTSNLIKGLTNQAKFILLKKYLFFLLRNQIHENSEDPKLNREIENLLKEMERIAGKEKNSFKKTRKNYRTFLAEIDTLTVSYLVNLWVKKDLIEAMRELENIFTHARKNINIIQSVGFFDYFINEYMFISNFLKLLLLCQEFETFSRKTNLEWQRELFNEVSNQLLNIAKKFFKYSVDKKIQKKLLILSESISGKFMEFIVFYLLRGVSLKITADSKLRSKIFSQDTQINNLLLSISQIKNSEEIEWSKKIDNTDIDILIGKNAIFIKTGIISSSDKNKIKNELKIAKKNGYKSYVMIDIGKNLKIAKEIRKYTTIIDIGAFFQTIYKICKEIGIPMELSRSDIKIFGGFTGG